MGVIGLVMVIFGVLCRYSVYSMGKKHDEELFLASVLNKTATQETGLYYTTSALTKRAEGLYTVLVVAFWFSFVVGAFLIGASRF